MRRKLIFILFLLIFCMSSASALTYGGCDFSVVARMKQMVTNINTIYDYRIVNDSAYFDVTISNVTKDIYAYDTYYKKTYYATNGDIVIKGIKREDVTINFYSNRNECKSLFLGSTYLNFPTFNKYYDDKVCEGASALAQCSKWVQSVYTYDEVKEAVDAYLESLNNNKDVPTTATYQKTIFDRIIDFYVKYYLAFLIGVIAICATVMIINKKKNEFKI